MPWLDRVLPNVVAIASLAPDRTLCTRFIPPEAPEQMTGAWQGLLQALAGDDARLRRS